MAITIRNNVFETNSSSTHSVTIKSTSKWGNILPNKDNIIITKTNNTNLTHQQQK